MRWIVDDDGSYVIEGRLPPEQGARIVAALNAAMDAQRTEHPDVSAETPIAARRADALERVAEGYLCGDDKASNGGDRCTVHVHTDLDTLRADGGGGTDPARVAIGRQARPPPSRTSG